MAKLRLDSEIEATNWPELPRKLEHFCYTLNPDTEILKPVGPVDHDQMGHRQR